LLININSIKKKYLKDEAFSTLTVQELSHSEKKLMEESLLKFVLQEKLSYWTGLAMEELEFCTLVENLKLGMVLEEEHSLKRENGVIQFLTCKKEEERKGKRNVNKM